MRSIIMKFMAGSCRAKTLMHSRFVDFAGNMAQNSMVV